MKARITRGKNFRGCVSYVSDRGHRNSGRKDAEYICGSIPHSSVKEMVHELMIPLSVKKIEKPVYHVSLAMPKGEERRSNKEWAAYAEAFMEGMGFPADTPYCIYRHRDTECDHIHIVASRVALDGTVFLGQKDVEKAINVTQMIEKEFGLTRTKGLGKDRRRLDMAERKMIERTQDLTDKQMIRIRVDKALSVSSSMEDFILVLNADGIDILFNTSKNGRVSGISFKKGDFVIKGSKLGSKYSYVSLSKKLPSVMELTACNKKSLSKAKENIRVR